MKRIIYICSTVLRIRYDEKGQAWLNFDKKFSNQVLLNFVQRKEVFNCSFYLVAEYIDQDKSCVSKVRWKMGWSNYDASEEARVDNIAEIEQAHKFTP